MSRCKARKSLDVMQCGACGLFWDCGDEDRPPCRPRSLAREKAKRAAAPVRTPTARK